jgi:MFS family permease
MTPVAFVLFAHAATHSFATASLVLAASTAGGLLVAPARGRLVDRIGPRDAVLGLAILQETTFIAGPLVAGAAIALWSVTAAVATTAGLSFAGALLFASAPAAATHERMPPQPGRLPALSGSGIRTLLATSAAFGLTFGVLDVAFPAFARAHGSAASAGVLLSAFAVGVWIGGFLYGLRPRRQPATHLYPRLCLLAVGAAASGQLIAGPGTRAALAVACGATVCAWLVTAVRATALKQAGQAARIPA